MLTYLVRLFLILLASLLGSGLLGAATYTLDDSSVTLPLGCTRNSPGNYTCPAFSLAYNDSLVINGTKPATLTVNGDLELSRVTINTGGQVSDLNLVVNGAIRFTNSAANLKAHVTAQSVCANNSNCGSQVFGGNLTVTAGNAILDWGSTVGGTLDVTGNLSLSRIALGQSGNTGTILRTTGTLTLTNSSSTFNGNVNVGGWSCSGSNCAQTVYGDLTVANGAVTLEYGSAVTGVLTVKGTGAAVTLSRVTLGRSGNTGLILDTTGALTMSNSSATIHGNVSAGSWVCSGSNCAQNINGSLTVASGPITLGYASVVKGALTAKGTNGAVVLDQMTLGTSGNTGTIIDTVGSVTFTNAGATLHGNVIAASFVGRGNETVNGDITTTATPGMVFGSNTKVTGCVSAATSTSPKAIQYGTSNTISGTCCRLADGSCYANQECVSGASSTPGYCTGATLTYEPIVVNAKGSSAGGVWPEMELWVNGTKIGVQTVNSSSNKDYTFSALYPDAIERIDVVFTNDAVVGTQDRNLTVNSVKVRGRTMLPTDPGVLAEFPYSAYGTPTQILAGSATALNTNGGLRFPWTPLIVGNCYTGLTGYTTIAAALIAAKSGDTITICPGTYNEALSITKSVGLRATTIPVSASLATVVINGNSSPAITLPNSGSATALSLSGLKLRSAGSALSAAHINAGNTTYAFSYVDILSTATAVDLSASNPGQISMTNSVIVSDSGQGIACGANAAGRLNLNGVTIKSSGTGIAYAGNYSNSSNVHNLMNVQVTTTGSNATGIEIKSGRVSVVDVSVVATGIGIWHDAGHSAASSYSGVSIRSVQEGMKSSVNLNGPHTYDNVYIRTSGAGAKGMWQAGGATFNDIDIESDGDAIYLERTNGNAQTYTNLTLVSKSGSGVWIPSSGTQITGSMAFGSATGTIKITAAYRGIHIADSMSSAGALKFNNVTINSVRDGIYLNDNMAGNLTVGDLAKVSITTTGTTYGDVWGLYVMKANAVTINKLTVDSAKGGVYLHSNVSGTVKIQGSVTQPVRITATGTDSHALMMNSTGGAAVIDRVVLRQPNGYGLEARANVTIGTISNFDIASSGPAINILSPSVNLTITDGVATSSRTGVSAIALQDQGGCSKTHKITNVIATAGAGGKAIWVKCSSTITVTGVCTQGGQDGLYFDANSGKATVRDSAFAGYTGTGLQLQTTTTGSTIKDSCFNTATNPMAFGKKTSSTTSTFAANYWQGHTATNKYQPDPNLNGVNDQTPRSTCHLVDTLCSGPPPATLIAHYRFEESGTYNGTAGEVKDIAAYSGGPFNGQAIGTPLVEKLDLQPAVPSSNGTCAYLNLPGPYVGGGAVDIPNLPVSTVAGAQTSVSFWMYWTGRLSGMPVGWNMYDLYATTSGFGFNTNQGDITGIPSTGLAGAWHHVVAVFTNGDISRNKLYLDGVEKTLTSLIDNGKAPSNAAAVVQSTLRIGGWNITNGYRFIGRIDEVKVFNGAVSPNQVVELYNESHACAASGPIAEWRMDELVWNGTANEVKDSSPYAQHGAAALSSWNTRASVGPGGKVCGRGNFTSSYNYVDVADSTVDRLQGPFTFMGWINLSANNAYSYIFSNSRDCCGTYRGFELLGRYGSEPPTLLLWFNDGTVGKVTAPSLLVAGTWAHVTGVWDGTTMKIYVNGTLQKSQSYAGKTMAGPSSFPGTIGAMGRNAGTSRGYYDLNGYLDELKAWDRALSDSEIANIYSNENVGLHWDGSTRDCDNRSPVADWRLDEGIWATNGAVKDTVNAASGPHGTAYGGVQTTTSGKLCSAGDFNQANVDGVGDYVVLPIPAAGVSNKRFSVAMWVKFRSLGSEMALMHITNTGTSRSRYFYLSTWQNTPGDSHNGVHVGTLATDGTWGSRGYASDTDVFSVGQWYHLLIVVDAERGRLTGYVNGSPSIDMSMPAGAIPGTPSEIWLGGTSESGSRFLDGQIDEVLLFNGSITEAQARQIYTWQNSTKNWDGSSRTCPSYGIPANFNCVESSDSNVSGGKLFTKLAGKGFSFDVIALKVDGTTQTAYATEADRAIKVELIDGSQTAACKDRTAVKTLSTAFTFQRASAATEKGRKTFTVADGAVPEAFQNVRCRVTDTVTTPTSPVYGCSTDNFAIRPTSLTVSTAASAPTTTPMNIQSPTVAAGADFNLAVVSGTANYKDNVSLDTSKLTAQNPSATAKTSGGVIGSLSPLQFGVNATNPVAATYSEVGYLFMAPGALRDDSFTTVDQPNDCISDSTNNNDLSETAIGGKYGCRVGNLTEITLGRFIPAYLSMSAPTVVKRADLSCSASTFTYYDEDFTTAFTVSAHAVGGGMTKNYTGAFARLSPTSWADFYFATSALPSGSSLIAGTIAATGAFSNGQASVKFSHQVALASSPVAPVEAISLTALPKDADNVTLSGATRYSLATDLKFRQGRARLFNALGNERLDLPMTLRIETWGGLTAGWVKEAEDDCTTTTIGLAEGKNFQGAASDIATRACVLDNSTACTTVRTARSFVNPAADGAFNLWLKAPNVPGFLTVTANVPSYLQFNWAGSKASPTARATFGLRKSNVAFRREVFGR